MSQIKGLLRFYPSWWRFQQILQNVDVASRNGEDLFYEDTLTALTNNTIVRSILSKTTD